MDNHNPKFFINWHKNFLELKHFNSERPYYGQIQKPPHFPLKMVKCGVLFLIIYSDLNSILNVPDPSLLSILKGSPNIKYVPSQFLINVAFCNNCHICNKVVAFCDKKPDAFCHKLLSHFVVNCHNKSNMKPWHYWHPKLDFRCSCQA